MGAYNRAPPKRAILPPIYYSTEVSLHCGGGMGVLMPDQIDARRFRAVDATVLTAVTQRAGRDLV